MKATALHTDERLARVLQFLPDIRNIARSLSKNCDKWLVDEESLIQVGVIALLQIKDYQSSYLTLRRAMIDEIRTLLGSGPSKGHRRQSHSRPRPYSLEVVEKFQAAFGMYAHEDPFIITYCNELWTFINLQPPRLRYILRALVWGYSQREIAIQLGVTAERISQILSTFRLTVCPGG